MIIFWIFEVGLGQPVNTLKVTCVTDGPDEIQKMAISALIGIGKGIYGRSFMVMTFTVKALLTDRSTSRVRDHQSPN